MNPFFSAFSLFLTLSHFQTRTLAFESFDIDPGAVEVKGFDEGNGANEISLSFTAGSAAAAATVSCKIHERTETECTLGSEITTGIVKKDLVTNAADVTLPLDIELSALMADGTNSAFYTFSNATKVGTLSFCGRCVTVSGGVEIGYAETLLRVQINQETDIPTITINDISETAAQLQNNLSANATYGLLAYTCTNADKSSTTGAPTNYPQGSYLEFCIKMTSENVTCAWVEQADIASTATGATPMNAIVQGQIQSTTLTSGSDKNAYVDSGSPSEGICYIKTQFPLNLVPKEGTAQMTVTGKAVMEFKDDSALAGRRFLRVDLSDIIDKKRGLKADEEVAADYTVITQVTASGAASTILAMVTSFFSVAGCIILIL